MQAQADPRKRYGRGPGTRDGDTKWVALPCRVPGIQLQLAVKGDQLERIVACTIVLYFQLNRNRNL
jgi:hypothetical protein